MTQTMYAVIETGGKQYRVSPGQTVEVELLPAEPGSEVALERVLLVSADEKTLVGSPTVAGARVITKVVREGRGDKIIVFKYKSKKRYRRTQGHRQDYMYLLVTDIQAEGESLVSDEDRKRYETMADRQARRYEARLMSAYAALGIVEAPEVEESASEA
ncbi:MAG TPA: 50S ribosomal protein L21 [Ktedonobacterales bacterium]|nr:50S ribosomal protein L21 [Ktedonobacterales bacterium]